MKNPPLKNASRQNAALLPFLAWLFVWSAFPGRLEAVYKYPIGIPKAWIDPDVAAPAKPTPWTKEIPGYYYVAYATGSDTGRTYGYPGAPRKTIPNPIPAGSRVEVNGLYNPTSSSLLITYQGDGGSWVANTSGPAWLVGADAENKASFAGKVSHVGSYGCIEFIDNFGSHQGMSINSSSAGKGRIGHHFLLRNSELRGTNSVGDGAGLGTSGNTDPDGESSYIIFYNNEVHDFGLTEPDGSDPDYIALMIGSFCHHIWALDNKLHDMSGSAFQVTANPTSEITTRYVYAGRNECYNLWGTGMSSKGAEYTVYSENHVHHIKDNGSISSSGGLKGQYAATEQWYLFNRVHDCAHGILRVSGNVGFEEHFYAIGNVIYDIYPLSRDALPTPADAVFKPGGYGNGAICLWGADHNFIIGNTMYSVPQGIITPVLALLYAENNIIANLNEEAGYHFFGGAFGAIPDVRIKGNLFFQGNGPIRVKLSSKPQMDVDGLNASSFGNGNLSGDPLFADATNKDFSILGNSPAKDAGRAPTALEKDVYDHYFKTFGVSIERDINDRVRPIGPACDIGAYERSEVMPPPAKFGVDILPK